MFWKSKLKRRKVYNVKRVVIDIRYKSSNDTIKTVFLERTGNYYEYGGYMSEMTASYAVALLMEKSVFSVSPGVFVPVSNIVELVTTTFDYYVDRTNTPILPPLGPDDELVS